ncbi:MAG: hypothetical protein AAFX87_00560 [Bacteroidota bacterium]
MKGFNYLFVFLISTGFFFSCSSEEKKVEEKEETAVLGNDALIGTWRLIKYINHADGQADWSQYEDNVMYEKYITPTHFTWVRYEKDKDKLVGIGGGTYSFDGKTYTENIKFFLPTGSNELGQAIPFSVDMDENGQWHHTGFAKVMEFDPEVGETKVIDSTKIEEMWVKVSQDKSANIEIQGTWELASYKGANDSAWNEYPKFVKYIKLITPSHFTWVKYNGEGDEVMAAGAGTYTLADDQYTENIQMVYPAGSKQVGTVLPFDFNVENNQWTHAGFIKKVDSSESGGLVPIDSTFISEIWEKYDDD